jgi:fatty acid-binding protein DegV
MIYHANNHEINEIKEKIEKIWGKKIESYLLSPIITNHIGLGAIALYIRKK